MSAENQSLNLLKMTDSLKFQNSFESASDLITNHVQLVQTLLKDFIRTESLVTFDIRSQLESLPQESHFRLLASPYVCELLMILKSPGDLAENKCQRIKIQLIQALIAEIKVQNPNFGHALNPTWTINGDIVLDSSISEKFPALSTDCGISLNYQSYIHNTGKAGIGGYDHNMGLKHKERIETAKKIIATVSGSALSMVDMFTTIIQLRQNKNRPNVVNSSTHTSIGLIRCDNFHRLHSDMPEIVDMLIHESIHQYLHLFEEQLADFVNLETLPPEILNQRMFPSPWSGNLLDIRSYTHAILVWYGLAHFWGQVLEAQYSNSELSRDQAKQKISEALFGFENSISVLDNLGVYRKHLTDDYQLNVERIQKALKTKVAI